MFALPSGSSGWKAVRWAADGRSSERRKKKHSSVPGSGFPHQNQTSGQALSGRRDWATTQTPVDRRKSNADFRLSVKCQLSFFLFRPVFFKCRGDQINSSRQARRASRETGFQEPETTRSPAAHLLPTKRVNSVATAPIRALTLRARCSPRMTPKSFPSSLVVLGDPHNITPGYKTPLAVLSAHKNGKQAKSLRSWQKNTCRKTTKLSLCSSVLHIFAPFKTQDAPYFIEILSDGSKRQPQKRKSWFSNILLNISRSFMHFYLAPFQNKMGRFQLNLI